MSDKVGPILEKGRPADALIECLKRRNASLEVIDQGSYYRVSSPQVCILLRADIEEILGTEFFFPQDLERIMPSFQGLISFQPDRVIWSSLKMKD